MPPEQPISMNLALIVHRVLTDPRGWRIDRLKEELGIADRTYRKYRTLLQQDFPPFVSRDGDSYLDEVDEGDARYLRFVNNDNFGVNDKTFPARIGAIYMAKVLLASMDNTDVGKAFHEWCSELVGRIRDREFVMTHLLRYSDRYFLNLRDVSVERASNICLTEILQALIFHRQLQITTNGRELCVAPLSIAHFQSHWWLVFRHEDRIAGLRLAELTSAEALSKRYTYPAMTEYDPQSCDWEEIFTNTESVERI